MSFDKLPYEINRLIGGYLDYNSRIEFSRALSVKEDKFVRKLDSESHDYKVRCNAMNRFLTKPRRSDFPMTQCERTLHAARVFTTLTDTLARVLLKNPDFFNMVVERATDFANKDSEQYVGIDEEPKQFLMQEAKRFLQTHESYVPTGIPNTVRPKLVTIA